MTAQFLDLPQWRSIDGEIELPGSKSLTNRYLLCAALAEGETQIDNALFSEDSAIMMQALRDLGIQVVADSAAQRITVTGCAGRLPVRQAQLHLGNAGTVFRPLTAVLALYGQGEYILDGVPRMRQRPIGDLVDALRAFGCHIEYAGADGYPPLVIQPASFNAPYRLTIRGEVSSQFVSALLLAAPLLDDSVTITLTSPLISQPYVALTIAVMRQFGVHVSNTANTWSICRSSRYQAPAKLLVESDASSASYFFAAAVISGGRVRVRHLHKNSVQGELKFLQVLAQIGAEITYEADSIVVSRAADLPLTGGTFDADHFSDTAMTLAAMAPFLSQPLKITGIASWRVKETDRIAAMTAELSKLGVHVTNGDDFIALSPLANGQWRPAQIATYDDHRMAMALSLAAFATPLRILDPDVTKKTYPDFFTDFSRLMHVAPVIAIDGAGGVGKGTIAQKLATTLGFHYLDSGVLYRVLAYAAQRQGLALDQSENVPALVALAHELVIVCNPEGVWLAGEEVTSVIRQDSVSQGASQVAQWPGVRQALLWLQRMQRCLPGLVADGRDIGTVIFPDAQIKLYLTATPEARAWRRYKQLNGEKGSVNMAGILQSLVARDLRDQTRDAAPLKAAKEAITIDTTALSVDDVFDQVLARVEQHGLTKPLTIRNLNDK